jgi:hypothetical protein
MPRKLILLVEDTPDDEALVLRALRKSSIDADVVVELGKQAPDYVDRLVFMTGGAFSLSARSFLDQVPNQRFEKPLDIQNLRAAVRRFLR